MTDQPIPDEALVDTNVLLVANGQHERMGMACKARCGWVLEQMKKHRVVVDQPQEIVGEYRHKARANGQGLGDQFLKHVLENLGNQERVRRVPINRDEQALKGYREFPDHPGLQDFDADDAKFVAAAKAAGDAPILEAADSKWLGWAGSLWACGVEVQFVCQERLEAIRAERRGEEADG